MAILYALGCLLFAAMNDFVFKLVSSGKSKARSCGNFVSIAGFVMVAAYLFIHKPFNGNVSATVIWGCIGGFLSLVSNVLVIESMRYLAAGVTSTIFRLNMVLVVLGAWLLLGEPLTGTLLGGVLCAFCAILALLPRGQQLKAGQHIGRGFGMALLACFLRACMSLSYKCAFSHDADKWWIPFLTALFWAFGGLAITLIQEHRLSKPSKDEWKISLISGVFVTCIIFCMARMNACGNASIVNPIAQMSFLGTLLLSCIFLKEKMTYSKGIAVVLGIVAVILLSL